MAYREVHRVESRDIIRRWQAGFSQRRIASGTGLSRVTVVTSRKLVSQCTILINC